MNLDRVATGIIGFDEMLRGGFVRGTANLVEGAPGTGKTTLAMQFIQGGVQRGEPGLILTFETSAKQLYRDASAFGWDFAAHEKANKLRVMLTSPEFLRNDLRMVEGTVERLVRQMGIQRVVLDSLSAFERLSQDPVELRQTIYELINGLRRLDVTMLLTRENPALLGETPDVEEDVAFVADGYILLRYVELEAAVRKALLVLKLRGSDHARDIRQYEITPRGLEVRARFEGQQGILSGSPQPSAAEAFLQAFGRKKTGR